MIDFDFLEKHEGFLLGFQLGGAIILLNGHLALGIICIISNLIMIMLKLRKIRKQNGI